MSDLPQSTLPPGVPGEGAADQGRRRLLLATCIAGGAAAGAATWPFLASMAPSERAKSLGAPVAADISRLEAGSMVTVEWQSKPVWILRRTKAMMETLKRDNAELADPDSKDSVQPTYCDNPWRARDEHRDVLVAVGICTHLGCVPVPEFAPGDPGLGATWPGGFLCPCHGSRFDLAARVFRNFPAPTNLVIPRYRYLSEAKLLIGDDKV